MRLNLFDYRLSAKIAMEDYPFYALIAAAMRRADTDNMEALTQAFPLIAADLKARYNAPGGFLPGETRPELVEDFEGYVSADEQAEPVPTLADLDESAGKVIDLMGALKDSLSATQHEQKSPNNSTTGDKTR